MMPNISQSGVEKSDCYFGSVVRNVGSNTGDCWMQMAGWRFGLRVGTLNPAQLPEFGMHCLTVGFGSDTPYSNPHLAAYSLCDLGQIFLLLRASAWARVLSTQHAKEGVTDDKDSLILPANKNHCSLQNQRGGRSRMRRNNNRPLAPRENETIQGSLFLPPPPPCNLAGFRERERVRTLCLLSYPCRT